MSHIATIHFIGGLFRIDNAPPAQQFGQLSKDMPQLLDYSVQSTVLPNLTQAIELLSAHEEIREVITAKIEAGEDVTIKEIQRLKAENKAILDNLAGGF